MPNIMIYGFRDSQLMAAECIRKLVISLLAKTSIPLKDCVVTIIPSICTSCSDESRQPFLEIRCSGLVELARVRVALATMEMDKEFVQLESFVATTAAAIFTKYRAFHKEGAGTNCHPNPLVFEAKSDIEAFERLADEFPVTSAGERISGEVLSSWGVERIQMLVDDEWIDILVV